MKKLLYFRKNRFYQRLYRKSDGFAPCRVFSTKVLMCKNCILYHFAKPKGCKIRKRRW